LQNELNRGFLIIERGQGPLSMSSGQTLWEEIMMSLTQEACLPLRSFAAPVPERTTASAEGERYVLVSHAPDSDSWWNTIKNGIALAGEQMGVEVEYRNPPTGDLADMARIIEQAAAPAPTASSPRWPITTCCPARSRPLSIRH
jgi:hypothetical protein